MPSSSRNWARLRPGKAANAYRSLLRLISGGVAAFARRSPVGASDTPSSGANSDASVTFNEWQMFARVSTEGLAIPLSIAEMYVRSTCASKASVSCDFPAACRHSLTRLPRAIEIGAGRATGGVGRFAVMACRMPARRLIHDAIYSTLNVVFTLHFLRI